MSALPKDPATTTIAPYALRTEPLEPGGVGTSGLPTVPSLDPMKMNLSTDLSEPSVVTALPTLDPAAVEERYGLTGVTAPDAIDHLLVRGAEPVGPPRQWPPEARELPQEDGRALRLSDHAPVELAVKVPG